MESIEAFMSQEVYPRYGNTHTTSSATGAQTTAFREEARRIIADAVNVKVGVCKCARTQRLRVGKSVKRLLPAHAAERV